MSQLDYTGEVNKHPIRDCPSSWPRTRTPGSHVCLWPVSGFCLPPCYIVGGRSLRWPAVYVAGIFCCGILQLLPAVLRVARTARDGYLYELGAHLPNLSSTVRIPR